MPTTTDRNRSLTVEPAEISASYIRASVEASRTWTSIYLNGLERAFDFQLKLAESYASAGEQYMNAAASLADRVEETGRETSKAVARTSEAVTRGSEAVARTSERAVARTSDAVARTSERAVARTSDAAAKTSKAVAKTVEQTAKNQADRVAGPTEAPIPGYDDLTAEEVVTKLPSLSQRTLAQVGAYERAHAARTTVLTRVESLTGKEPAPGYDELTVADIQKLLNNGDEDLAKRVRDYERAHGARNGVLQTAERQLKQD
jgi:hypothetical protein